MKIFDLAQVIKTMQEFLRFSRNKSQNEILRNFLTEVIRSNHFSEDGSILLDNPKQKNLILFNPDNFLTREGYLEPDKPWQNEFRYGEGIAGRAFVQRETINVTDAKNDSRFSVVNGSVPIENIICLPIIFDDYSSPFGIISFHNSDPVAKFEAGDEAIAETYAAALSLALAASPKKLQIYPETNKRIFIGCASEDIRLAQIIQGQITSPAIGQIWNQGVFKAGGYVLETLLSAVKSFDYAIFLFTPNDIVKFRDKEYVIARDNVIFEAGIFFSQLGRQRTFLIVPKIPDLKLPSDLDGLITLNYNLPRERADTELVLAPICFKINELLQQPLPPLN